MVVTMWPPVLFAGSFLLYHAWRRRSSHAFNGAHGQPILSIFRSRCLVQMDPTELDDLQLYLATVSPKLTLQQLLCIGFGGEVVDRSRCLSSSTSALHWESFSLMLTDCYRGQAAYAAPVYDTPWWMSAVSYVMELLADPNCRGRHAVYACALMLRYLLDAHEGSVETGVELMLPVMSDAIVARLHTLNSSFGLHPALLVLQYQRCVCISTTV